MRWVLIGVAALVVVGIAAAALGGGSDDDDGAGTGVESSGESQPRGNTLFPGRADVKDKDIERTIGQAAELSGYTATVTKVQFAGEISQFEKDGYLLADVDLLNRDDGAQSYNTFEWKLLTPNGQIIDPYLGGKQLGSGDLASGGTVSGQLIWEVGQTKGDFYVIYDPSDLGVERAVWKATI